MPPAPPLSPERRLLYGVLAQAFADLETPRLAAAARLWFASDLEEGPFDMGTLSFLVICTELGLTPHLIRQAIQDPHQRAFARGALMMIAHPGKIGDS